MKAKKMIVPILMGALMAFAILPMTAGKAYAEDYELYVGGTPVTSDNALDILGNKTVSYDAESKTLTLNGVTIPEDNTTGILSKIPDLKIEVHGENKLSGQDIGIYSLQNLTITGEGSLEAEGLRYGIYSDGDITIKDATVTATGTDSVGIGIEATGEIKIEGRSKVQAKGSYYAIVCDSGITLGGGHAITEPEGGRVSDDGSYIVDQNDQQATSVRIERVVKMNGDGTEESPYQIKTYEDLKEFASIVNGKHQAPQNTAACGELENTIIAKNDPSDAEYASDWTPIGTPSNPYIGHFDGDNHIIKDLSNEGRTDASNTSCQGLFGYIGKQGDTVKGEVKNVGLEGGKIIGSSEVGGVAGLNDGGTITNCYNTGAVNGIGIDVGGVAGYNSGGTITNCYNTGAVSGESNYVGGVAGDNYGGEITNCYNTGAVSGQGSVGGMAGHNKATIKYCYNTGAISGHSSVGGVTGYNNGGTTVNSYNTGAVSGDYRVGGVAGFNDRNLGSYIPSLPGTIVNCYNTGVVSGTGDYVGGLVGKKEDGTITNCYYDRAFNMFTKAVGDTGDTGNVKGLTTSQMTGETALADSNMFFSYNPGEENPWIVKANGIDPKSGDYYLYYPHLKGFAYDSSTSAADWPAKVIFDADWSGSDSYTYNASAQKPTVTRITVSQKPVEVPEGKTAEYSRRTDGGWEPLSSAPTDPGSYKMTVKDEGKVIDEIVFVILYDTDYTVNYYEQTGEDQGSGAPIWSTDDVEPIAAGTYEAVVTDTDGTVLVEKVFQIKKAPLTITAKDQTLTYNGKTQGEGDTTYEDAAQIAEKVTVKGLQGSDKLTKINVFSQGKEVGEYPITPSDAAVGNATGSYAITYVNGKLTITKAKPKPTPPQPKPDPKPQPKINKAAAKIALDAGVVARSFESKVTASWGAVKGASSYVIYANYCGQKKLKKIRTVSGKRTSFDITKLNGRKFNPKKNLKFYVVAYKTVKGKKVKLAKSITAHAPGSKNSKRTNVTGVKVKKASFTLKKDKTAKIKARLVLEKKHRKPLKHEAKFRYASSNEKVAKVSRKGKITAVGKGRCTVYVYAISGVSKKIKVTVK